MLEVESCWGRRSEFSGGWIGKEAECGGAVVFVAAGGAARHQPGPPTRQRHRHGSPPCVRRKQGEALGQTQPENNCLGIIVILGFNTIQQEKWEFKHLTASKQPAGNNGNQTSYSSVSADYMFIAVFRSSCCNVDN